MTELFRADATEIRSEIAAVFDRIDSEQFDRAAELLASAPRIFVLGVGREGLAARGFAMRLMHLGIPTHWGWDDTTPAIEAGDLMLLVNGSGSIGHLDYVFARAEKAGAKTLVVTAEPSAVTPSAATATLGIPAAVYRGTGDLVRSIQPMGSLFEQCAQILFDVLVLELMRRTGRDNGELAARHRNIE